MSPARIAAINRRAVPTYQVRPRVLAGTQGIPGAVQVQRNQLSAGAPRGPARKAARVDPPAPTP